MPNQNEQVIHGIKAKYVFFVLLAILLIPSIFFIMQSYFQLNHILTRVNSTPYLNTPTLLASGLGAEGIETYKANSRISLEHDVMVYRQQRAAALLSTRTWMRFMSLMFGSILVVIGGGFILGKIVTPRFKGELSFKDLGASVATSSPGLLLVLCGMVLISIPNLSNQRIVTVDASTYVSKGLDTTNTNSVIVRSKVSDIRKKYLK